MLRPVEEIEWFKNSREFAKEVRARAIARANRMAHDCHNGASSLTSANQPSVSSSTNAEVAGRPRLKMNNPPLSFMKEDKKTDG